MASKEVDKIPSFNTRVVSADGTDLCSKWRIDDVKISAPVSGSYVADVFHLHWNGETLIHEVHRFNVKSIVVNKDEQVITLYPNDHNPISIQND